MGNNDPLVLIVDDQPVNLKYLTVLLEKNNYRVVIAENGADAIDSVWENPPDVILLDIMMPDMDGFEVCERLKKDSSTKDIPILFITALTDNSMKLKAFEAGGTDYITKPFVSAEVLARVKINTARYRVEKELQNYQERLEDLVMERTKELIESEAKYRNLIEHLPAITYIVSLDEKGTIQYVSPQLHILLEFREDEWRNDPDLWKKQIHPDDRLRVLEDLSNGHLGDLPFRSEYRMLTRSGAILWFQNEADIICDPHGHPLLLQGVMLDITKRKKSEEMMKRYEFIANNSKDFMTLINKDHVYEAANNSYCKAINKKREDFVGHKIIDVWGKERYNKYIKRCLDGCFEGNEVKDEDWFDVGKQGKRLMEVIYYPYFGDINTVTHAVVVSRDITEHMELARALRVTQERYKTLFENAPEAIVVYNLDKKHFIDANENAVQLFKYDLKKLLTLSPMDISPPTQPDGQASLEGIEKLNKQVMEGENTFTEWIFQDSNGNEIPCELRLVQLPSSDRRLVRGSMIDITERKEAEKKLLHAQEMLTNQEKRAIVGGLTTGLAHEVKNQLNTIGFLELLKERFSDEEKEYVQYIYDSRDRIVSLLDEVRGFAKNEDTAYSISSHDLKDVIKEVIFLVSMDPDVKNKEITYSDPVSCIVSINKDKIIQVLFNLIRNAAQAIEGVDKGEIIIKTKIIKGMIEVQIIDNGLGIDETKLTKIWEPFFTTKGDQGTGIGLDLCNRIIGGHDGTIHCVSKPQKETSFIFTLPLTGNQPTP